jgi:predicted Zn-dependent protease
MQIIKGAASVALIMIVGCATSPTGRKQLTLLPEDQMSQMGGEAFQQLKQEMPSSRDPQKVALVRCVAESIVRVLPEDFVKRSGVARDKWEVVVFEQDDANAFALPGGKIGVHTGLLKVAKTPDQLAAVIGHEVGHVVAEHGNERVSQTVAAQTGLSLLAALAATSDPEKAQRRQLLLGLIGVGAQVGILLPFSRTHESEADRIGLDLMARAGFNPEEAVALWKNMSEASGGAPPEFLSTHPAHGTRIQNLTEGLPQAKSIQQEAISQGRRPQCANPQPVAVIDDLK